MSDLFSRILQQNNSFLLSKALVQQKEGWPTLDFASVGSIHFSKGSSSNGSCHLVCGKLPHAVSEVLPYGRCISGVRLLAAHEDNAGLSCVHERANCPQDISLCQPVVPIPAHVIEFERADLWHMQSERADLWHMQSERADLWHVKSERADLWHMKSERADLWHMQSERADLWHMQSGPQDSIVMRHARAACERRTSAWTAEETQCKVSEVDKCIP